MTDNEGDVSTIDDSSLTLFLQSLWGALFGEQGAHPGESGAGRVSVLRSTEGGQVRGVVILIRDRLYETSWVWVWDHPEITATGTPCRVPGVEYHPQDYTPDALDGRERICKLLQALHRQGVRFDGGD